MFALYIAYVVYYVELYLYAVYFVLSTVFYCTLTAYRPPSPQSLAHGESNVVKSSAMNVMPFGMTEEASRGLLGFKSGAVNWVELTLEGESIDCLDSICVEVGTALRGLVSGEDAR
jgi:hypothetical protein